MLFSNLLFQMDYQPVGMIVLVQVGYFAELVADQNLVVLDQTVDLELIRFQIKIDYLYRKFYFLLTWFFDKVK